MAKCCGNDVVLVPGPQGATGGEGPPGPPGPPGSGANTWDELADKPTEFPPSAHTHPFSEITGTLPVTQGGTGLTSYATGRVLTTLPNQIVASTYAELKALLSLDQVSNTSDANKPISTATQTALNLKANQSAISAVGFSGNAADLTGVLNTAQLPPLAINETFVVASQAAMLALTAQRGDMAIRTDVSRTFVLSTDSPSTLADWKEVMASGQVASVAGKTGVVTLVKGDVGLGNVDNTSDLDKPVSTATTTALAGKANSSHTHSAADVTSGTLPVTRGGTNRTSHTAYALIAGGTSTTAAQQSIGNGTSGHFLKSNGSSALPGFAAITAADVSDSTTIGRNSMKATSLTNAQNAIGIVYDATGTLDPTGLPDGTIIIRVEA